MRFHLALAALLAAPLAAQGSFDLDKALNGQLGTPIGLSFANAPAGSTMLFMTSLTNGPIALSLVDVNDTRSLSVGFDLASIWFTIPTGTGSGSTGFFLPNNPSLAGLLVNFQGLTVPGTTLFFGAMSNPVTAQLGVANTPTGLPRTLVQSRAIAQGFRVGHDIVLAGGGQGSLLSATGLATTERYDGRTMQVVAGATLNTARALAFSTKLNDGRVLICGGVDDLGTVLSSAEIYDPATNAWTPTGSMSVARAAFDGTILNDGRVMVAGGTTTLADAVSALAAAQNTVELYNPTTGQWSSGTAMPDRLLAPDLTLLQDGRVLLSGGFAVTILFGIPIPVGSVTTCRRFTPGTGAGSWAAAASMRQSRGAHGLNTIRMLDGRVLVTGGIASGPDLTQGTAVAAAEYYDPTANLWTALPSLAAASALHTTTLLSDGRIAVVGGAGGTFTAPVEIAALQTFDPSTNTFTSWPNLLAPRAAHVALLTEDNLLVILGGQSGGGSASLATIETVRL
ncbi:MAG: kelch repeat-containing protein [Planctomycetota bacterium]